MKEFKVPKWIIEEGNKHYRNYHENVKITQRIEKWLIKHGFDIESCRANGEYLYDLTLDEFDYGTIDGNDLVKMIQLQYKNGLNKKYYE